MLPGDDGPAGEKVLQMTESRIGEANPPLNNWVFGGDFPYEARSTRGAQDGLLNLRLRAPFVSDGRDFAVKMVFATLADESQSAGLFLLGYRSSSGWTATEPVHFDDSYEPEKLNTVTFRIDDADFSTSQGEASSAIQHLDGAHAGFLMIRVLRLDRD